MLVSRCSCSLLLLLLPFTSFSTLVLGLVSLSCPLASLRCEYFSSFFDPFPHSFLGVIQLYPFFFFLYPFPLSFFHSSFASGGENK